ncbi:MAG: hypothetical protein OZ921_08505 [Sorangiineae bacterium]|nr:hypothetical protein [Polyangiaceae bacterium]MEB2322540.1 hypothetical protein [Sorangiineae bacterium]
MTQVAWAGVVSLTAELLAARGGVIAGPTSSGTLTMTVAGGVSGLAGNTGSALGFAIGVAEVG